MEKATFGAGCFWGVEEAFRKVRGVCATQVGYAGGDFQNPTYEDVCGGKTGHAEVVEIEFDPSVVSYGDLLKLFWKIHDPTTKNRQGPDEGEQYRSMILFHSLEQRETAERDIANQGKCFSDPIVTEVVPCGVFYQAEEYHQKYVQKKACQRS